ncbi:CubicO group peptidase (beta-lactamase class C family) [Saonia flava]|uniref:CubicO group peptidase (Beta-lactamase class C family) n=1 Tax=Saonia flava TaxID=523696 RepID=A0A846QZH8_9FLAO|nr:serine hydrolase [Saonia flava]NJB72320.1 CubicO group peptidase (beta-lactamase class C family) [Saonia flava]
MRPIIVLYLLFFVYTGQAQLTDKLKPSISGLSTISLEKAGFHKDSILNLLSLINNTPPNDFRGLVVIKNNKIVLEEYFNTYWRNSIHDIRSAGKSVTALLLGIALEEGLVQNLDQNVYSFFDKSKYPNINKDYKQVTLRHLLNMSSGLDADTNNPQTTGHAVNWIAKDNWRDFLLQVPLTSVPGSRYIYADINPLLISSIIEETSGMSLKDFAKKKLFNPLGIDQVYWYTNSAGQTGAAGNLYISTLDFAKLGVLVANEGRWGNRQIINPDFIRSLYEETFDLTQDNPYSDGYGMLWYKSHRTFGVNKLDYIYASGNGGNLLIVVPEIEMVIALTSSAYGPGIGHGRSYTIMSKILASIK